MGSNVCEGQRFQDIRQVLQVLLLVALELGGEDHHRKQYIFNTCFFCHVFSSLNNFVFILVREPPLIF